jgi:hypothetical protein
MASTASGIALPGRKGTIPNMLKIGRNKHQWRDLEADGESPWRHSCKSGVVILTA